MVVPVLSPPSVGSHSHTLHQLPHFVLSALIPDKHQVDLSLQRSMLGDAHSATCWFVGQEGQHWPAHIFK